MTNGDRIRSMNDEEMAVFLKDIIHHCNYMGCRECPMYCPRDKSGYYICGKTMIEHWLQQEVTENGH